MLYSKLIGLISLLWPVLALSLSTAYFGTILSKRLALRLGITDIPDNLVKTHKGTRCLSWRAGYIFGIYFWRIGRGVVIAYRPSFRPE